MIKMKSKNDQPQDKLKKGLGLEKTRSEGPVQGLQQHTAIHLFLQSSQILQWLVGVRLACLPRCDNSVYFIPLAMYCTVHPPDHCFNIILFFCWQHTALLEMCCSTWWNERYSAGNVLLLITTSMLKSCTRENKKDDKICNFCTSSLLFIYYQQLFFQKAIMMTNNNRFSF